MPVLSVSGTVLKVLLSDILHPSECVFSVPYCELVKSAIVMHEESIEFDARICRRTCKARVARVGRYGRSETDPPEKSSMIREPHRVIDSMRIIMYIALVPAGDVYGLAECTSCTVYIV